MGEKQLIKLTKLRDTEANQLLTKYFRKVRLKIKSKKLRSLKLRRKVSSLPESYLSEVFLKTLHS